MAAEIAHNPDEIEEVTGNETGEAGQNEAPTEEAETIENDDLFSSEEKKDIRERVEKVTNAKETLTTLVAILKNPETTEMISTLKDICKEKQIELDIDRCIETYSLLKDKFVGFTEKKDSDRIMELFLSIAGNKYYEPAVISSFFEQIELKANPNMPDKFMGVENNKLFVFDNFLRNNTEGIVSFDQMEFCLLHEMGHIVDFSEILNETTYTEGESEEDNSTSVFQELVEALPLEFQDSYSISCAKNGENSTNEIKATMIAIWSRNRGNPEGFAFERLRKANSNLITRFFGKDDKATSKLFSKNSIDVLRQNVAKEQLEEFDKYLRNSAEIFKFIEESWQKAKKDPDFLERLGNIEGLETTELYNEYEYESPSNSSASSGGSSDNLGESSNKNTNSSPGLGQSSGVKSTSLGEVFDTATKAFTTVAEELDIITRH